MNDATLISEARRHLDSVLFEATTERTRTALRTALARLDELENRVTRRVLGMNGTLEMRRLRHLAEAATQGEWSLTDTSSYDTGTDIEIGAGTRHVASIRYAHWYDEMEHARGRRDAAYIVAARPEAILLILDQIAR